MKHKRFVLSFCLGLFALFARAGSQTYDGIYVTVAGTQTCYKLDEVPTVTYTESGGIKVVQLTIKSSTTPVVSLPLTGGATLEVFYGTYKSSDINPVSTNINIKELNGKKFISGGRLIIIGRDGKQYSINGTLTQ